MIEESTVRRVLALIGPRELAYRHFFGSLGDIEWLGHLYDAGYLVQPPEPLVSTDSVRFPQWVESACLLRLARRDAATADTVAEFALKIPATDNIYVNNHVLEIAALCSPSLGVQFVSAAKATLVCRYGFLDPLVVGKLAETLAIGGYPDEALALVRQLLELDAPDPGPWPKVKPKFAKSAVVEGDWYYGQILTKYIPVLAKAAPSRTVALLADLLGQAASFIRSAQSTESTRDYSEIWLPDLAVGVEHYESDLRVALAHMIVDIAVHAVTSDAGLIPDIISELQRHPGFLFKRIELQLLVQCPGVPEHILAEALNVPDVLEAQEVRFEYRALTDLALRRIDHRAQQIFFELARSYLDRISAEHPNSGSTVDDWPTFVQREALRLLEPARRLVPADLELRLGAVCAAFPGMKPELPQRSWVSHGPQPPMRQEEFDKMEFDDVLTYVGTWKPPLGEFLGPSYETVAELLSKRIAKDVTVFTSRSAEFRDLEPAYVRALFDGAQGALRGGLQPIWPSLLDLADWAARQADPVAPGDAKAREAKVHDWRWVRTSIARLLELGLAELPSHVPAELGPQVWSILSVILGDGDPPRDDVEKDYDPESDPYQRAINSTRGVALEAAVEYIRWSWHLAGGEDGARARETAFLDSLPAVKAALNDLLDPKLEGSTAVRSVLGQRFAPLAHFDRDWVAGALPAMFPPGIDGRSRAMRDAVWEAYIQWGTLNLQTFNLLRAEYDRAARELDPKSQLGARQTSLAGHLADHLLTLYINGIIPLDAGLVPAFFEHAPATVRAAALSMVGRWMLRDAVATDAGGAWPTPDVIGRLQALWSWRAAGIGRADDAKLECAEFGIWFEAGVFPLDWRLIELERVLRAKIAVHMLPGAMAALVTAAKTHPGSTLTCLDLLVDGPLGHSIIGIKDDDVVAVFDEVARTAPAKTVRTALQLLEKMGGKGAVWLRGVNDRVRDALRPPKP